jgi:glycerate 2-kinase
MPRVLLAPDKLKGCLTAPQVVAAMLAGLPPGFEPDPCPLSDGGDGFVLALASAAHGTLRTTSVTGPLPDSRVDAVWAMLPDDTAVIELATASGLALVPPDLRNPLHTTTYGTGELLLTAARAGARRILLGIGGSATVDAGLGLCQAAGHTILRLDAQSQDPREPLRGRDLPEIHSIKRGRGSPLDRIPISVACDVDSPLTGPRGAAQLFGPQKGATPADVAFFETHLTALATRSLKQPQAFHPGSGAAGGVGWAMLSFFNATLVSGFDLVSEAVGLRTRLEQADLCLTAEGRYDATSTAGKLCHRLARLCRELNRPCHLLAGRIDTATPDFASAMPDFASATEISPRGLAEPQAFAQAPDLMARATRTLLTAR